MSDDEVAAELLFTPRKSSVPLDSDAPGPPSSPEPPSKPPAISPGTIRIPSLQDRQRLSYQPFFVKVPHIPEEQRQEYREIRDLDISWVPEDVVSITGEYTKNSTRYYYGRCCDGLDHRFPAEQLKSERPELVEEYEKVGRSSTSLDRGKRDNSRRKATGSGESVVESEVSSELSELESDAYSDESLKDKRDSRSGTRRRTSGRLPFSPRKTRSKRTPNAFDDSDDELLLAPVRRSTRTRNGNRISRGAYAESIPEDDADEYVDSSVKVEPTKKKSRRLRPRPAYGHIRPVSELSYDSDKETRSLRAHRNSCEKCQRPPTHLLLHSNSKRKSKKSRRTKKEDDDDDENEEEDIAALGGWVQCLKCPVAAHWGCLARTQRDEILKAVRERDQSAWQERKAIADDQGHAMDEDEPQKRDRLDPNSTTHFICGSCTKGGVCMVCKETVLEPDQMPKANEVPQAPKDASSASAVQDVDMDGASSGDAVAPAATLPEKEEGPSQELLFRCVSCKRLAHYAHLPSPDPPETYSPAELAEHYQSQNNWRCADCISFIYSVEHILAWRPFPENAVEPPRAPGEIPNYKSPLPREYLVKWVGRSYRRVQWVPHMWLLATHAAKLRNFLAHGSSVELLPEPAKEDALDKPEGPSTFEEEGTHSPSPEARHVTPSDAVPDAERRIKPAWKTVDRVLDVYFWSSSRKNKQKGAKALVQNEDRVYEAAFLHGDQPADEFLIGVDDWLARNKKKLDAAMAQSVVWAFIKWDDLGYDDATWDSPPREGEPGFHSYVQAFQRYIDSRSVTVPLKKPEEYEKFDDRPRDLFKKKYAFTPEAQPRLGQSDQLSLMPFQVEGVNWLCNNWSNLQHCILADEMGLGKTVQIVTFLGAIIDRFQSYPALVVVPNSTITNWVREFERWAPRLRVVPFYGEHTSREVIKTYELWHKKIARGTTGAKFHVLVTTFETINSKTEFGAVFRKISRWEVLVVDEGQRLKSDSSLIFKKLRELNTIHRIILTGTPLNNNIRELFNLMNFLDPTEWNDLAKLAKEHEELTEERIKELHQRLRPYFLRRIKSEVLELPPKNEVIIPVSMAPLQKEIYRSILSQNIALLKTLTRGSDTGAQATGQKNVRANMNNILMQLRKCLQHPYLVARDIEPKGLGSREAHEKLIDASAKLRILRTLLPKLKARGHRVLLFSQFAINLDILEDFLIGEGFKYLRLDGNTKQSDRQKGMDEFNKPDSDVFIYILTTRAGGVGINLWSADTVIIYDPDFNPHQDLQAIARAHRYGQKKTCLVFKLMVKDSAEERIMQTGKKKLVLDHLIVQKMDDDEDKEDVQSILMFGAQALFESDGSDTAREINYTDHDLDHLIEKTETEVPSDEQKNNNEALFSFAKVWSAEKDSLEDMNDASAEQSDQIDSWAQTLERIAATRLKEQEEEVTGRGARRKAAAVFPQQIIPELDDSPTSKEKRKDKGKGKKKGQLRPSHSDDSDFRADTVANRANDTSSEDEIPLSSLHGASDGPGSLDLPPASRNVQKKASVPRPQSPLSSIGNRESRERKKSLCGLCGTAHEEAQCPMIESSENLAKYREMLLSHTGDETFEERKAAIELIDETLAQRGMVHLIQGQPLYLVDITKYPQPVRRQQKAVRAQVAQPVRPPPLPPAYARTYHQPSVPQPPRLFAAVANPGADRPRPTPKARPSINPTIDAPPMGYPLAGPSKRPNSPRAPEVPQKKIKSSNMPMPPCVLCGATSHGELKRCPVVQQGSTRIKKEIRRLRADPGQTTVVDALNELYRKQKKRELASSNDTQRLPQDVVIISD